MSDPTLILLAKEIRNKTLKLLDPVSEADAKFAAPGLNNSILWHAGHSLVVVEHLAFVHFNNGQTSDPPGYFDAFSWKSNPATVTAWPTIAEVRSKLADQRDRLVAALERADDAMLNKEVNEKGRTVRWSILHGLHDEAGHQGEIWLLRKMLAKK